MTCTVHGVRIILLTEIVLFYKVEPLASCPDLDEIIRSRCRVGDVGREFGGVGTKLGLTTFFGDLRPCFVTSLRSFAL